MKPRVFLFSRSIGRAKIHHYAAFCLTLHSAALAGNTWDGGAGTGNWGDGNNWNANGAPAYGTLVFSGNTQTTTNNNSVTAMNQVNWNGTAAWVMNGSVTLSLFDNGGTQAKLESLGSGGVTINANITFAANNGAPPNPFGEINAVSSNIAFTGGTLTVNGSSVNGIKFFGGAGRDVSFANTVSASGKWFGFTNANGSSVTIASGGNVTTGDFYVMNGNTLNLSGGTLTTSAVRLGGDFGNTGNQNQTLGGTLALTPLTGGVNFSSVINTVSGNTSNALLIDSKNTSGTNTLSGSLFLDSDLRTLQQAGGTLAFTTGSTDIKARKLTVDGAGTTSISQVLSSSLAAGGSLVKTGAGTLILSNTSNTYTGTNSATLNANGTQIAAGTLAIAADTSLGLAPAGAYNNVQFTGTGTLRSDATISLNSNRNISIASGATAGFDSNGNTFTINGAINGATGNIEKTGAGTVVLTGANSHNATTITTGTLQIGNGGATGTLGSGSVTNNAALVFNRSGNFNLTNAIGGTGTLAQSGSNIITISSANTYSGATTINSGVLRVTANEALGTGAAGTTVNSGGQLRFAGVSYTTAEALTLNGIGGDGNGALVNVSGASSYAGQVTVASNSTIRNTGSSLDLNGALQINSSTTLTVAGTGPTYVNGTGSGTGAVSVDSGATLGGSGSVLGAVSVSGTLAPGNSIESLGTGAISFTTGSTFAYELNSASLNGDLVDSTGSLDIAGTTTLTLTELASGVLAVGSKLTLISYFGGWTSGELFTYNASLLADDSTFTLGSNTWKFDYNDISGGSNFTADQSGATSFVTMTVIPEPSAALLGGLGMLALLRRRRA